jgi:hypothetical protein
MSAYIYDGVSLVYPKTTFYEMATERDPSYTDVLWNKYTIRCRGFCYAGSGQIPGNSAAALQFLKNSLEAPRRSFLYQQGAVVVLNIGANAQGGGGPAIDAKLGPEPLPTVVREVTSGTFAVETGVIVRKVECITEFDEDGNPCPPNPVVSLRWSQEESFDDGWYSQLTTEGRLIVRSDLLQSADNFRPLVTPPILTDYMRKRSRYKLSPDGLMLDFTFVDQEVDRLPPYPAVKASGAFTVLCPKPGILRIGNVQLKLEGQKGTDRKALLVKAFNMAYAKLRADGFQNETVPIIWGQFREDLFSPVVEVSMQANLSVIQKKGGFAGALIASGLQFGLQKAGLTTFRPQVMPSVGTDTFGLKSNRKGIAPPDRKRVEALLTAAFADPCACQVQIAQLENVPNLTPDGSFPTGNPSFTGELRSKGEAVFTVEPLPPNNPTPNVIDTAPYNEYMLEAEYRWEEGIAQTPGTGVVAISQGGTPTGSTQVGGNQAAFTRYHGGMMTMDVVWVCGRTGDAPILPAYQSQDPNLTALGGGIVVKNLEMSADGSTPVYLSAGYYHYGATDPTKVALNAPVPPFLNPQVANQIAPLAVANYSNVPLFSFVGATGPNPFVLPTTTAPVNTQWADGAAQSVSAGIRGAESVNPTTSSSGLQGSGVLGGLGGQDQGGGIYVGGGAVVYA